MPIKIGLKNRKLENDFLISLVERVIQSAEGKIILIKLVNKEKWALRLEYYQKEKI